MSVHPTSQLNVVTIGGGTGSFTLLRAFKDYFDNLTAIVNMADSGGSTGQLRDELGALPPGDVRQCLVALSESPKIRDLFSYRFEEGSLSGHSFGNLFITALEKMTGSFVEAIATASEVLRVKGSVIPATLDSVQLKMAWPDKQIVLSGEKTIDTEVFAHDPRTATLSLEPTVAANPIAIEAIMQADIVVLAPGDLYTSLGPVLVAGGIKQALEKTPAKIVYTCNLVTKPGQTDGFLIHDFADEIERFIGSPVLDYVLYNTKTPATKLLTNYTRAGELLVPSEDATLADAHYQSVGLSLIADEPIKRDGADAIAHVRSLIRHDAKAVAEQLLELA